MIVPAEILLPKAGVDMTKWAVIACDQFTSQPEYWRTVAQIAGEQPSALNMIIPESQLSEAARFTPIVCENMRIYDQTALEIAVNGGVLVERETTSGARVGIVVAVDLAQYDYSVGSRSPIRATEGTILSRLPQRIAIREKALLELPHIMLLIDDPAASVIEPIYAKRDGLHKLYDADLMLNGGRIRGWAVENVSLNIPSSHGITLAVGDGNHSLAAAKQRYEQIKDAYPDHPSRYALVEINNLHSSGVAFHPIHRLIKGADLLALTADFAQYCAKNGINILKGTGCTFVNGDDRYACEITGALPVEVIQNFLDDWLNAHPEAEVDYIHGEGDVKSLATGDAVGIIMPHFDKGALFPYVAGKGALPRKAFSIGQARDKRYYMEARRITY